MAYRDAPAHAELPELVLRPRMNRFLIGLAALFLFGPLGLQATLWSSVVSIRCVHIDANPRDVRCEVRRDSWVEHETSTVESRGAYDVRVKGTLDRGDAWMVIYGNDPEPFVQLTPRLNVAKDGLVASSETLRTWLSSETWREDVTTSYGSPWGAIYVPLMSTLLCAAVAFLVTQRVRMRLLPGGRVVVDASLWLGPRTPYELALDDIRCVSFDGPKLVLVTKDGTALLAKTVMPKRADLVVDEGNAWLEEARGWRERAG